jgi:hypothetical protein
MQTNERFQHLQSQIDGVKGRVHRLETRSPDEPPPDSKTKRDWWDYLNTGLMTVFTGFLFLSSMLLWWATKDAISDTHASFETGTRAWVVGKSAFIKPTKSDRPDHYIVQEGSGFLNNRSGALSVELVNAGHSPAFNVTMNARVDKLDKLPADNLVIPRPSKEEIVSKYVVAPDGTFDLNRGLVLTDAEFQGISNHKLFSNRLW